MIVTTMELPWNCHALQSPVFYSARGRLHIWVGSVRPRCCEVSGIMRNNIGTTICIKMPITVGRLLKNAHNNAKKRGRTCRDIAGAKALTWGACRRPTWNGATMCHVFSVKPSSSQPGRQLPDTSSKHDHHQLLSTTDSSSSIVLTTDSSITKHYINH